MKQGIINLLCLVAITMPAYAKTTSLFSGSEEIRKWRVSNDTVMGGISQSSISLHDDLLLFNGELRLENNGGFTSVWRTPESAIFAEKERIAIVVKGDGRAYQFRLRSHLSPRISYTTTFQTQPNKLTTHTFIVDDFSAVWRGRQVTNAPELHFDDVVQMGFLLADKQPGQFSLSIKDIQ